MGDHICRGQREGSAVFDQNRNRRYVQPSVPIFLCKLLKKVKKRTFYVRTAGLIDHQFYKRVSEEIVNIFDSEHSDSAPNGLIDAMKV